MRKKCTLKVGDTVFLNNEGLETIYGTHLGLAHMKKLPMKLTFVDSVSLTSPEATFPVEVDHPEINQFLLYDACFDKGAP